MVVVWSLPCNSQSLSISLPQPPRSLLPAFMGSLRICGKGTLIARGLRSSENGEKEVIACPRSIHHRVKSPALLDTIRSVVPFPSYLAISLTYEYDLDREMLIYMCVALGRSKNCMWYQLSLLRVIQFELQWPQVPIWSTMASKRPSTRGRQALGRLYNRA